MDGVKLLLLPSNLSK